MSMSPIRLIAYSPYTFSRFFNGAIGKHPDEVYVKRKRKSFFRACINRSPRRVHAVLQLENEGGVIDKKLLQILLFRGKLVVNSSFGTSTCLPRALIRLGSRHTCAPTQWVRTAFFFKPTHNLLLDKHRYLRTAFTHARRQNYIFR